jgi:hypothetical protein
MVAAEGLENSSCTFQCDAKPNHLFAKPIVFNALELLGKTMK